MNSIQKLIIINFLLLTHHQPFMIASTQTKAAQLKAQAQAPQKIAQAKSVAQAHVQARPQAPVSTAPSTTPSKASGQIDQLVEKFMAAVAEIKCSCGVSKKGEKADPKTMCKHDKQHTELVKKAYQAYDDLYNLMKKGGMKIDHQLNEKVLPSVHKIFQCKNIKNQAWIVKTSGAPSKAQPATK